MRRQPPLYLWQYLSPGAVFVDIGANIGHFSAIAASIVGPTGAVHAFEPVPRYRTVLDRLQHENPRRSIVVNACAFGNQQTQASIDVAGDRNIGWNSLLPDTVGRAYFEDGTSISNGHVLAEQVEVTVMRFDDYAQEQEIERIDLIKIDVEGFEMNVLRGMETTVARLHPPILVELSPHLLKRLGVTPADVAGWANRFGYRAVDIDLLSPVSLGTILDHRLQATLLLLPT